MAVGNCLVRNQLNKVQDEVTWDPCLRKKITHVCGGLLGCDGCSTGLGTGVCVTAKLTNRAWYRRSRDSQTDERKGESTGCQ